jgi:branched-chain amino acid transport system substrate-binding protein
MRRRTMLQLAGAAAIAGALLSPAMADDVLKIGAVAPKTGPLAGGAAVTQWPNVKLWAHDVNARGGLNVGSKKYKIEIIEYDDQTNPSETIKAVQRLVTQDGVDFVLPPYSTGINLAVAPLFAKYGMPLITSTATSDQIE